MQQIKQVEDVINGAYKQLFPDRKLKDKQVEILTYLLQGNDVLAVLATGYGKSVGYQLPLLITGKNVIVISPLLALMKDQHENLAKIGIKSICMNSEMSQKDKELHKINLLANDDAMIIFMTPEYFIQSEQFVTELASLNKLCLIAIDESHCISMWGHDFRKSYLQLGYIKTWVPNIPIYACTATATPKVEKDIIYSLNLQKTNLAIIKSSYNRDNLIIDCKKKNDEMTDILGLINMHKNEYSIVYVKTREDAERIANKLTANGCLAKAYHGEMTKKARISVQDDFTKGNVKCIVATVAFGMGIDQTVRLVIHYGLPNDIESYYQEIGRAGRDGVESMCVLFWSAKDIQVCKALLKDTEDNDLRKHKEYNLRQIEKYVLHDGCRKRFILNYFGETLLEDCGKCDNSIAAAKKKKALYDPAPLFKPSHMILKTLFDINRGIGSGKLIDILRGSRSKQVAEFRAYDTFGKGTMHPIDFWKELIRYLIYIGYLEERTVRKTNQSYITMSDKGIMLWIKFETCDINDATVWNMTDIPDAFIALNRMLPKNNTVQHKFGRMDPLDQIFAMDDNNNLTIDL